MSYYDFASRFYKLLSPKGLRAVRDPMSSYEQHMAATKEILQSTRVTAATQAEGDGKDHFQFGTSRIFLRSHMLALLDAVVNQVLSSSVIKIQAWARSRAQREEYLLLQESIVLMQAVARAYLARKRRRAMLAKLQKKSSFRRAEAILRQAKDCLKGAPGEGLLLKEEKKPVQDAIRDAEALLFGEPRETLKGNATDAIVSARADALDDKMLFTARRAAEHAVKLAQAYVRR